MHSLLQDFLRDMMEKMLYSCSYTEKPKTNFFGASISVPLVKLSAVS